MPCSIFRFNALLTFCDPSTCSARYSDESVPVVDSGRCLVILHLQHLNARNFASICANLPTSGLAGDCHSMVAQPKRVLLLSIWQCPFNMGLRVLCTAIAPHRHTGGWGVLNREIVSFRSCVRTRVLVA